MHELIGLLPFADNELLRFGSLFCLLSLFHMSTHLGADLLLQYLGKKQQWRKIQAREAQISALTEIR